MIFAMIEAMRPKQWTKNVVIFAGVLFSLNIFNAQALLKTFGAFGLFCIISGMVYIINDIADFKRDLVHPEKKLRPIASGRLPRLWAGIFAAVLAPVSITAGFFLSKGLGVILVTYFIMNLAYSFVLKHIVILDVLIIAFGFVLRAVAGAAVIDVPISEWLLICTFLLALFLGFCKRRNELNLIEDKAAKHRAVLQEYSSDLLDQMIAVVTASALMAYALYTISDDVVKKFGTQALIVTVPFVLFAIFRYLYLVLNKNKGGSPEKVLIQDKAMMIDISLWVVVVLAILYFA